MKIAEQQFLRDSPEQFIQRIFGYRIAPLHAAILAQYNNIQETLYLAPRGSGKTRIGNIGYCGWKAVNNPNIRILILSDTDTHAIRFLGTIKTAFETHLLLHRYYGELRGAKWTDHELVLKTRTDLALTEATISAMGMYSGAVTTGHYDIIIADDLINFDNTRTEGQRERAKTWFKTTMLPTLLPGGEIHCLGTRYHYDDLWDMITNDLGYDTQIQHAIMNEGTINERSYWEWHMPLHTKITDGRKIKGLIEIRDGDENSAGIGSLIFNLQYQNDVELQKKGRIFEYDWFKFYDTIPLNLEVYQGVDLAISKEEGAAFFVILTLGRDKDGNIYLLDIYRERGVSFNTQRNMIKKKAEEWKPIRIGIETNAYQEALAEEVQRLTVLPIFEITTTRDKTRRAQIRSGLVENGHVYISSDMHSFISELVMMPDSNYKDQFDAFDFALTALERSTETQQQTPNYYIPNLNRQTGGYHI